MRFAKQWIERAMLFPGSATQGSPEATVYLAADDTLEYVATPEGDPIAVALRRAQAAPAAGVVYCYGNGMSLAGAAFHLDLFAGDGRAVAIPEYRGYGLSGGEPSEEGCVAAGTAAKEVLERTCRIPGDRLVFAGWSLGAAVALELAARYAPAGLILCSPFTSLSDVAGGLVPSCLRDATRWATDRFGFGFNNLERLRAVRCPILLVHGRRDALVPFEMSIALLGRAAPGQARLLSLPLAGHNDLFDQAGPMLAAAIETFCDRCLNSPHVVQGTCS